MVQVCGEGLIENSRESTSPTKGDLLLNENTQTSEEESSRIE